ncbi:MAG: anthranilate synthase component I family protein [Planctomycetes bacterium]|nr:anthranilate synthase component I family protein [Planctomycetota bacterium]
MSDFQMRPRTFPLEGDARFEELFTRLSARRGAVALLPGGGRHALLAFDPLDARPPGSIEALREYRAALAPRPGDEVPGPFHGGFVGALAYDLGVAGERAPRVAPEPWGTPRVAGGLYTDFVVLDAPAQRAWLVLGEDPGDARPALGARRAEIEALLAGPRPTLAPARAAGPLVRRTPPAEHCARIERLRARIAAGDLYQANLAHRFERALAGDPRALFLRLLASNPAPHAAWLAWDPTLCAPGAATPVGALLSASPELLLEFDGALARTRPIKGTAPRGADPATDAILAAQLLASEKDRAELAMIVDLERNDLGACARPGGVRVEAFPRLESFATVHHLVADVVADVAPGVDAWTLLARLFPGGSITGAPKLAALDAIAELETEGRGFFTGSLGFVDVRGHARWNILIRTLVWRPRGAQGEVCFHAGGGITWPSDAEAEERETLHKALGLVRALEGA